MRAGSDHGHRFSGRKERAALLGDKHFAQNEVRRFNGFQI